MIIGCREDEYAQSSLDMKPNGLGLTNLIPVTTLKLLAEQVGLNILSIRNYEANYSTGFTMDETDDGQSCGLILEKPADASPTFSA